MAQEWVKDAKNETRVKANLCTKADKALGAAKQENQELIAKLIGEERCGRSEKCPGPG